MSTLRKRRSVHAACFCRSARQNLMLLTDAFEIDSFQRRDADLR